MSGLYERCNARATALRSTEVAYVAPLLMHVVKQST